MKLKFTPVLILLLALGACTVGHRVPPSYVAEPGEEAALLVGSMGYRTSGKHESPNTLNGIVFRQMGAEETGEITLDSDWLSPAKMDYEEPGRKGILFALHLQPGDYELVNVRFFYSNGQVSKSWQAREDFSVPFTLEAGKAYYIGDFLARGDWGKNIFGITIPAGGHFVHRYNAGRDLPLLEAKFPELADKDVVTLELDAEVPPFIYSSDSVATKGLPATN